MDSSNYSILQLISDIKSDIKLKSSSFKGAIFYFLFSPQIKVLFYYRLSHWLYKNGFGGMSYIVSSWQSRYGCYISRKCVVGQRVRLLHPVGIVIGDGVIIEDDVSIWQNCTLGSHGKPSIPKAYPYVEKGVKIYGGSVLIGDIRIGKNSIIGANSVILSNVPENSVAVGVPYKRI